MNFFPSILVLRDFQTKLVLFFPRQGQLINLLVVLCFLLPLPVNTVVFPLKKCMHVKGRKGEQGLALF